MGRWNFGLIIVYFRDEGQGALRCISTMFQAFAEAPLSRMTGVVGCRYGVARVPEASETALMECVVCVALRFEGRWRRQSRTCRLAGQCQSLCSCGCNSHTRWRCSTTTSKSRMPNSSWLLPRMRYQHYLQLNLAFGHSGLEVNKGCGAWFGRSYVHL